MIILDLDEKENLIARVRGQGNWFYKIVYYLKNMKGTSYDPTRKVWLLPRELDVIEKLEQKFLVGSDCDKYILTGEDVPAIPTAVDKLIEKHSDINEFLQKNDLGELREKLRDFQKLGVATALYFLRKYQGFLIADDMGLGKTIEAIAVIKGLRETWDKVIVSCPKNVKYQWAHVYISHFVSKKSIDEKILAVIKKKRNWFDKIVRNTASQEKALKEIMDEIS